MSRGMVSRRTASPDSTWPNRIEYSVRVVIYCSHSSRRAIRPYTLLYWQLACYYPPIPVMHMYCTLCIHQAGRMNIGTFQLHASKRRDITIILCAVWKCPPITVSVNLFRALVWMLTFEFTMPHLNMTHANIFHYPRL